MNTKLRIVPREVLARRIAEVLTEQAIMQLTPRHQLDLGIQQTCLSCRAFNEETETCESFNARPPARVIAFGCTHYVDCDDIPF